MQWTKRKLIALLALVAGGITGGVLVTRDGADRPPPQPTTRATPADTRTRARAAPERSAPERPREARAEARRPARAQARRRRAPRTRTIRPGDTLWGIATEQLGRDASAPRVLRRVQRLAALNDLEDPDLILAGARLRIRA
jgi:nucleoid-associated protein YgaU